MSRSFSAQLDSWVKKSENRLEAVFKTSAQDLAYDVTTPKSRGGRMPVDTGFLMNSILAGVGNTPVQIVPLAIQSVKLGEKLTFGFTAIYAPYMEYQNGFVRLNAQRWPQIVDNATRKVRAEFP